MQFAFFIGSSSGLAEPEEALIRAAMDYWQERTCVHWLPKGREDRFPVWINRGANADEDKAYVGMVPDTEEDDARLEQQILELGEGGVRVRVPIFG